MIRVVFEFEAGGPDTKELPVLRYMKHLGFAHARVDRDPLYGQTVILSTDDDIQLLTLLKLQGALSTESFRDYASGNLGIKLRKRKTNGSTDTTKRHA